MSCHKITTLLFMVFTTLCTSAALPDSIVIMDNSWSAGKFFEYKYVLKNTGKKFQIYQTGLRVEKYKGINKNNEIVQSSLIKKTGTVSFDKILVLVENILDTNYTEFQIQNFGYDMNWLRNNTNQTFSYLKKERNHWTKEQELFVKEQLTIEENYNKALKRVVGREDTYVLFKHGGTDFKAFVYFSNLKIGVTASENPLGMPWILNSRQSCNPMIPKLFSEIIPENESYNKARFVSRQKLLPQLAESIYDDACSKKVLELAALEFKKEFDELRDTFSVLEVAEYNYRGRYLWDEDQVFKVSLKNNQMQQGIFLQYMLGRRGDNLYSRDSLLRESHAIIERVQSIDFLMKFLKENSLRTLDVYYFNNNAVNDYIIDGFNKNPEKWAEFEKYEKNDIYLHLYCGCNLRLDNDYLLDAIFFELIDEDKNPSIWILLPDNTLVLHHFGGKKVYKYTSEDLKTSGLSVQDVCLKFNSNGEYEK